MFVVVVVVANTSQISTVTAATIIVLHTIAILYTKVNRSVIVRANTDTSYQLCFSLRPSESDMHVYQLNHIIYKCGKLRVMLEMCSL